MTKTRSSRKQSGRSFATAQPPKLWGKDTLLIDRMSQEGRGVGSRAGKIVFVNGALAGEQVRVQCTAVKRDYDEAELIELLPDTAPSMQRVEPECPIYRLCGGCTLQHWALTAQQQHKQESLLSMLQAVAPTLRLDPPILSGENNYRHRLRLLVTRGVDRSYIVGLRQRRSHAPVNVQHCLVATTAVNRLLQALPNILLSAPDLQGLREIEIDADSNNQLGLCFYFAAHPGERIVSALHSITQRESISALRIRQSTQRKSYSDQEPENESTGHWRELHASGELILRLAIPGVTAEMPTSEVELAYLPGDFTQTHWEVNAALVKRALEWLQPRSDETALDLFSGIGNFAVPLAHHAKTVQALEGDINMTARILTNAKLNGLENISANALNLLADEMVLPRADIAIIDPPRAGAKAVSVALARSKVKRIVYISCHAATLARDARVLLSAGLKLRRAAAVDMFPHTGHSEAIALFERK